MKLLRTFITLLFVFVSCWTAAAVIANPSVLIAPGVTGAILIFTAPGGAGVAFTFNMTYLPEFLYYNHAGAQLTSLRVETQEDGVLHDWTAAGLNAMNGYLFKGAQVANNNVFRIADGEIRPRNVTISGVTSAAGAIGIFVSSDNTGANAFKSSNAAILALNPTVFTKFTALFIPGLVTLTDRVEIEYADGHVQNFDPLELSALSAIYQEVPGVIINNVDGYIKKVTVFSALGAAAYVLSVFIKAQ